MDTRGAADTTAYLLLKTSTALKQHIRRVTEEECATKAIPYNLLTILAHGKCTLMTIANKIGCSKQEASRLIKRALEYQWVNVSPSVNDKREKDVSLSHSGLALLDEGGSLYLAIESKIEKKLGAQKLAEFKQLLAEVSACID